MSIAASAEKLNQSCISENVENAWSFVLIVPLDSFVKFNQRHALPEM